MKKIIIKTILKLFPELTSKLHLPKFAKVVSIPDMPVKDSICDSYRPKYAVNVRILDQYSNIDQEQKELQNVPLALAGAGNEKGFMIMPEIGSIVEIAFAYGSLTLPFIRCALPYHLSLSECNSDSIKIQKNSNSYQEADRSGNWKRKTNGTIEDISSVYNIKTLVKNEDISSELRNIKANSTESITGIKKITAGALKLLTTGSSHLGAAVNNNITSGCDINLTAAQNLNEFTGGNKKQIQKGNFESIVSGNSSINIFGNQSYKAPKTWIGSDSLNFLQLMSEFMQSVSTALDVLSSHTHPLVPPISEGGAVAAQKTKIDQGKSGVDSIKI